jgi:hypothetical protein
VREWGGVFQFLLLAFAQEVLQQTADNRQQKADSRQPAAESRWQTADKKKTEKSKRADSREWTHQLLVLVFS